MPVGNDLCRTPAGQRFFFDLPGERVGLAADALEHVPVSRPRGAGFPRFRCEAPAGTSRLKGPPTASRNGESQE
jgi:hypothetical protein